MNSLSRTIHSIICLTLAGTAACHADIWLPSIFGDHMVLQAEKPIAVWGKANVGESVTVELLAKDGTVLSAANPVTTAADRKWSAELPAVAAGQTVSMRITGSESGEKILTDVLTGEVWLLSGQSNMHWTVGKSKDAEKEIAAADHPGIRIFQTEQAVAGEPLGNLRGQWEVCSPETIGKFSAAGYFFGRDLHQALKYPVGLINSSSGGTPIQTWTPLDAMNGCPETAHISKVYDDYRKVQKKALNHKTDIYRDGIDAPAGKYNAMIAPLMPFAIRGAIWSQGERNGNPGGTKYNKNIVFIDGPEVYSTHFPLLIESWRKKWGQGEFPFLYVELANFMKPVQSPVEVDGENRLNWTYIREAQAAALSLPNVFGISAIDVGEADDIHYKNKQEVGRRLALAACGQVYKKAPAPSLSPRYSSFTIEGNKVRLKLSDAIGLKTDNGKPPQAFAISGSDGKWHHAETAIDGEDILVWHNDVASPAAVRHAWASNPDVNVYNKSDLPLMPFRTDTRP